MKIREATVEDITALETLYKELVPDAPVKILPESIKNISKEKIKC